VSLLFGYEEAKSDRFALTGNGELRINNRQGKACELELIDNAYGAAPVSMTVDAGGSATMNVPCLPGKGWYDYSLRIKGVDGFEKRFAGRIETGKEGISDPQMA
jgi:phospholipase C